MLDLTSVNHKRGIMVLTSKDVRTVDRTLFDYTVQSMCEQDYLDLIENHLENYAEGETLDLDTVKTYLKFIRKHNEGCRKMIHECRNVFN